VSVWSEEGVGSTFTLRIPLAAGVSVAGESSTEGYP
jgi:signal transduction histidine kinase